MAKTGPNNLEPNHVYLDYNASTPIDPEVLEEMLPFLKGYYGNPSSSHWASDKINDAIQLARTRVADLLGSRASEVVFTSGGSESNNHAIKGTYYANRQRGHHMITTRVEHPSVINPFVFLESIGATVTYLDVDKYGLVNPDDLAAAITNKTILVSVMHANNETETIQPIHDLTEITRSRGVVFHTDAAQSVGKIDVKSDVRNADLITVAGHKLYAPKGIGALIVREGTGLISHNHGAGHESGRRAGTENVPYIVGLGKAAEIASRNRDQSQIRSLTNLLWDKLSSAFSNHIVLNGHLQKRLPNTLNVSFAGRLGHEILAKVPEIAATTGSACHTGSIAISPVLSAMKVPPEIAAGTIRFSLGRYTTAEDINTVCALLIDRIGTNGSEG